MGGRKEKEDRTLRRGYGRESRESIEHRDKSNQGTDLFIKKTPAFFYNLAFYRNREKGS